MALLPTFQLKESSLSELKAALIRKGYTVNCTKEQAIQRNGNTLYREWLLQDENGIRVIFWDKCSASDRLGERQCIITIASPDGCQGKDLLGKVIEVLISFGATDLVLLKKCESMAIQ